jgi:hypothetical protein
MCQELQDDLYDRMQGLIEKVSRLSPASAEGAAFQIMLASAMPDRFVNGLQENRRRNALDLLERLLYRALDRFRSAADAFPDARNVLMPVRLDPDRVRK